MEETHQERLIIQAAEELFLDKGFAATSTTEIAKKAGCNQALVHYYFRTKERLFYMIFISKVRLFLSSLKNRGEDKDAFLSRLRFQVEAHFDILAANPKIPFLIASELVVNPERRASIIEYIRTDDTYTSILEVFDRELQEAISRGEVRSVRLEELIQTIVSLNVMTFIASPILSDLFSYTPEQIQEQYKIRKALNWDVIQRWLEP